MSGSTYYQLNWVADAGVNYTLQSLDAKLMLAGGKFYDLATATPYNPASGSLKGAEYTLTALDGTKYELDAERGLVGQIAANGTKLIYSDAGIIPNTPSPTPNTPSPESVRFVKDSAGNITQITAPNGTQLSYEYDSIGNLVSVRNSATGEALKYGYEMGTITPHSSSSRLTVISNSTGGVVINDDGTTTPITRDLGGIANFNGKSMIQTNDARQIYSFNLKPTELNTTNNQTILIGVEGAGDIRINGTAPVSTQGNYRVFAVDKAGINLLEITNPGATFKLSLVGDLNSDNRVDGVDTQLLTDTSVDLNQDGVSNAQDLQLLGGNYGFVGNSAPVITPVVGLTHVDLSTRIDLSKLATDVEGDLVAFSVKSGVHGKAEISADGKYAIYTPESGFGGTGGFELIASDGFSSSKTNIDVNVSTAALVNLDIINRNPKLQVGDKYQLQIVGDFADQKGVSLTTDYLTYGIINSSQPSVITVDSQGLISAVGDGTGVITADRNGISAFTATRVGTFNPTTTLDSLIKDAETNGLNAYPGAVTLIPGMARQILVSPKTSPQNPNSLTDSNTGTNYYIGNPNILEVSSAGLITVKQTGSTTVTVINHGAEDTISVRVELPLQNNTQLGTSGGAIQTADGSLVTIAQGALTTDTTVSIQQLTGTQLTLPLPTDYQLVGAFQLNVGDKTLKTAAQIAIPAPTGLASGTEVFFLQKGELPNEQGVMQPIWLIRESGKVGTDGMIRTSSPPWNGVTQTGEFSIVVPTFNYSRVDVEANISKIAAVYSGAVVLAILSGGLGSIPVFQNDLIDYIFDDPLGTVQDGSTDIIIHIPTLLNNVIPNPQVSILTIPNYGLPYQTTANIEINPGQIPTAKIDIVPRASGEYQPAISSVELKVEDFNGSVAPLLTLTGENFGEDLSALKVDLISATGEIINLPIITSKSAFSRLVVQPSNLLPINAQSQLQITRTYQTAYQPNPTQFKSELVDLPDEPLYRDVSLVPLTWDNKIAVYNTTNPQSVIASSPVGSPDLLLAKIPVGKAGITSDGPRFIAVTSDATVAYTPLEGEGRVAVIDLISLQQVNTNDGDIDPTIELPAGATPFSIVIGTLDKYAYVADRNPANGKGQIYVIDIDPRSVKYNKHVQTIQVGTNLTELSQMALSRDGKSLFITAPKATDNRGHIIAVNVDITIEGDVGSQWHKEVSNLVTNLGVTGISAAPIVDVTQPNRVQMVITNRQDDNYGFGVITVEDGNFATAKIDYKPLLLGSSADYFDVNEAVAVTITSDGKYAFVAGKNSRNIGRLIPSVDADSRAGSNIGIISNPLTSNAKLVAATLPIPDGRVNGLALSGDGKVLTAAYQGLGSGSIFAFDVEEIIKTIEDPELYVFEFVGENSLIFNDQTRPATIEDLQYVPIDRINSAIDKIGADLIREKVNGQVIFGVPIGSKNAPLVLGGNTYSVTAASDWLDLSPVSMTGYTEDLTPTFNWQLTNPDDVQEVNLFVSTFDVGEGLLPGEKLVSFDDTLLPKEKIADLDNNSFLPGISREQKEALVTRDWYGYRDYNPGRILTASWNRSTNNWTLVDGTIIGNSLNDTTFTLPDNLKLTAGAQYHWAVLAKDNRGKLLFEKGDFNTLAPISTNPFSSVTILTHGFVPDLNPTGVPDEFYQLGNSIIHSSKEPGLMLSYDVTIDNWLPTDEQGRVISTNGQDLGTFIQNNYQGKPLVLLPSWATESVIPNSGFTEAVADKFYAALVSLDQKLGGGVGSEPDANGQTRIYDDFGNLIIEQGDLFNSPLHFIGFSRGAVVNSEIIQRLGTYFPDAGGKITNLFDANGQRLVDANGKIIRNPDRELQMTTLDPHDFEQANLNKGFLSFVDDRFQDFSNFYEPKVKVWENVTYADNYYQERANPNSTFAFASATPNGGSIKGADVDKNLTDLTGFRYDNGLGNTHSRVLAWYAGTLDLNADKLNVKPLSADIKSKLERFGYTSEAQPIYDALGSKALVGMNINSLNKLSEPWYEGHGSNEGVGEGWYYSALGGGKDERGARNSTWIGESVKEDNTDDEVGKGDFAVPTLFNGNFDAIESFGGINQLVPGWSGVDQGNLVDGYSVGTLANHWTRLSADTTQPNYDLRLTGGQSVTHNAFTVPDWGALRFDLHTPSLSGGRLSVTLEATDGSGAQASTFVTLQAANGDIGEYVNDTHLIGYGTTGFETFTLDIPDNLRGKVATLRFTLNSGEVYLDNIFFKSQHLLFGNPTESRNPGNPVPNLYRNNYLLEKAQYSVSYSGDSNIPNWSAWQLNQSWLNTPSIRPASDFFREDPTLGSLGWSSAKNSDYDRPLSNITPGPLQPNGQPYKLAPGHLSPNADRGRNLKDANSTFLTSNIVPQHGTHNNSIWRVLEAFERDLATQQSREAYIYAGGVGEKNPASDKANIFINSDPTYGSYSLQVPDVLWKVFLILDRPGLGIQDITTANTKAFAVWTQNTLPQPGSAPYTPWNEGGMEIITISDLENRLNTDANNLARGISYDFFSNLSSSVRQALKITPVTVPTGTTPHTAFLTADISELDENSNIIDTNIRLRQKSVIEGTIDKIGAIADFKTIIDSNIPIGHDSVTEDAIKKIGFITDFSSSQVASGKVNSNHTSTSEIGSDQLSISQIGIIKASKSEINPIQVSSLEISTSQTSWPKVGISQVGIAKIDSIQTHFSQDRSTQINTSQIGTNQLVGSFNFDSTKISFPSSITLQQLLSIHNSLGSSDSHNPNLQNTTVPIWTEFLQSPTPFNLKIEVTDLPTGQLAEATITGYDTNGRPNSGTLTLDTDGNSLGWFIDTTPDDNTEFDQTITTTAYRATTGAASGKYDLLTTILHELGHLNGIIRGNTAFDTYVQNINGVPTFINGGITATLTPDGSHLDSTLYPYDLMNTSLKPGVRKLPSALNLAMIDAINSGVGGWVSGVGTLNSANLTAGALIGITNGDFTTSTTWNTAGATNIINGTATLTEQSQKLSELTQAFIIPQGAKTLQFTIKDNHLITGDTTKTANDAFEVALLDTNTFNPLAGTSIGLNHTDSLLNIQANGTIHKSDKVTITALGNNSSIVTIDLTQITPSTQATLYFNLLGFGARTSTVTIDDVKLFTDTQPIPITKNDTLTTNQNTPLTLTQTQLTTNDTNVNTIQIINQPTHGTLTQNPNGKLTYTPIPTYIGNDSFTYLGFGSDGQISNLATVNLTINNLPPTIETLIIPTKINEGQTIQLSATATDGGSSENLTYKWDLGDGSQPVIGQNITHQFLDNGTYNVNLTVTDFNGSSTQQSTQITVDNLAPTLVVDKSINTNINQGETITFGANYSDSGSNDSLNITWDFGDGSEPISFVNNPSHQFTKAGTYNVTVTITDNDGASTTDTIPVTINNLAPTINTIDIPTNIKEGETVQLTATASDAGNDTLTYNWYINSATTPIIGQTIDYNFANSGTYPVKLEVIDSNGAITTQTVDATITNVAPTINQITIPTNIKEGDTIQLIATASDIGNDALTYNWYINNALTPITGATIDYTFTDNGIYPVKLEVIDTDGAVITQTVDVTVANVAPSIVNIVKPTTINEGESVTFSATATDPGILDTLIYSWNFGDNTDLAIGQNVNHKFADNGNYNLVLTVTDKDGGVTAQTVVVKVDNVAPIIVSIAKPSTIKEGESVTLSATATDPGTLDTLTYSWNFGENTTPVSGQNVNHTFVDNGNYNVVLTVTDKDGSVMTQTIVAKVDNVAPTIVNIAKPTTIKEGESIVFSATATDPGIDDTLTYSWNFGDNTTPVSGQNATHIFADNGNYNVVLTVTDKDGGVTTQMVVAKVDNVAPTIVSIAKPSIIKEGESVTFSATATDPGTKDTLTYSWNFGDNTTPVSGQNATHTFADNGNYNVVLTVTDKDGAVTTQTVIITVDNVAPTIVSIAKPDTIKEGESVTFTATVTDPGILDTLTYSWNFGDNTNPVIGQNVNHTFVDNGNYNVVLTVTDKDGGVATQTVVVKVDNVAPTIVSITKPDKINEGQSATFTTTATDPGTLDTLTYSWNFGDSTTPVTGQNVNHTWADNGNYNVVLTVTDKDGAATTQTIIAKVDNVAPVIASVTLPQNVLAGTAAQFTATATDVGTRDTLTYTWNFGDNTTATTGANSTHTFTTAGTYTVVLTVTDKDGAITTTTQNLTVTAPPSTGGNGIRAGGNITINGSANFDGDTTNRTDDTKIYAGFGISLNGNITLPVKRDGCGNPIKVNGKIVLVDNQITLGTGANTSSNPNQYTNITTATQTITIPTYADIKLQSFTPPTGTVIPTFNIQTTPIRNSNDWNTKLPPAGTATNPTVVRIINGDLNLPANINLSNYILIVENGSINFSQGNPVLNNVKLIANCGNINLNSTTGTNLSLSASGNINITGNTKLGGNSLINSNGNITTNGGLSMVNTAATVKMISQGDLSVNGNTSLKGQLFAKKNVTINGQTTLVGSVDALLNVSISGNSTVLAK